MPMASSQSVVVGWSRGVQSRLSGARPTKCSQPGATTRLIAGSAFSTRRYVYEPVGAAYYYAQRLKSDALVLVADFGGGTSHFSLIRFERRGDVVAATPLGYAGLAVAGDNFDYRIINAVVSPHL